jgi:hypothetical protein
MNEKLQAMLMECYSHYAVKQIDYEKFAQLIIDDILKIIGDPINYNKHIYTTHDADRAASIASEITKKIKEHFKVMQ